MSRDKKDYGVEHKDYRIEYIVTGGEPVIIPVYCACLNPIRFRNATDNDTDRCFYCGYRIKEATDEC